MRDRHLPAAAGLGFRIPSLSSLSALGIVACMAAAVPGTAAHAQTAGAPTDAASSTVVAAPAERQPEALGALTKMGDYLRSLARFEVDATSATDAVLDNGQTVSFAHRTELKVQRPDRLRADVTGSRGPRGLVYDGATFTIFNTNKGYYSKNPAPDSIDGLVRELSTTYGIETPLADLFYWGNGKVDDTALTSALFIGLERIDSRWCNHYAYRQDGADWELWLQTGSRPLPCRMIITDTTQPARPRHVVTYHWTLNPSFSSSTFIYRPSADARAITLRPASQAPLEESE
ncbi:MAG: DUF2092 domain-containing protein [Paraburkholderia sp.]|uniref:DUF2092 domain-containing protein n=1 Tax=Paraburkholderia sp. TaxID=1926495 RepID=UPI001211BE15|nr:DUF2092 domain-containing protein [Paraburkholderia sp.]TAL94430.1 MAG: DUF2092 domain-containing protein [Paraburkholderia sp.]